MPLFHAKNRGFTTIELLIAIAVLVILIGIVVVGANQMTKGGREKDTKVRLESLAGMLTEFEATTGAGLRKQPNKMYYGATPAAYTGTEPIDIWRDADPSQPNTGSSNIGQPLAAPGPVTEDAFKAGKRDRFGSTAVHNTQVVMGMMLSVPAVQEMLNKLPAESRMSNPNTSGSLSGSMGLLTFMGGDKTKPLAPAILVDAWGNPIIFVPASGLSNVTLKDHPPTELHVITSMGVIEQAELAPAGPKQQAAGVRPFFASPGPDGDFTTGDDNLYSFDN